MKKMFVLSVLAVLTFCIHNVIQGVCLLSDPVDTQTIRGGVCYTFDDVKQCNVSTVTTKCSTTRCSGNTCPVLTHKRKGVEYWIENTKETENGSGRVSTKSHTYYCSQTEQCMGGSTCLSESDGARYCQFYDDTESDPHAGKKLDGATCP
jgi:hypothetical protein